MAVYYKFKSARDYDSISMDGPFISVGILKEKIFESKHLGRGTDFDLVVTNAQTSEEYLDEGMLIPKNTSVLIRRVPGRPRMPIVTAQEPKVETVVETVAETQPEKTNLMVADSSAVKSMEDFEWDEFGNDLYSMPEVMPVHTSNIPADAHPTSKADEDSKIRELIETPALDWQRQGADGFGSGRGFGRGMGRMGGRGFGLERKTPPQGYVCHRCKVPGHFIQHCPTNGDPNYDIKRVKPPTGIPKSMLQTTPDGSYALPSGAVAVLKPNEDAFEREIQGLPSTRPVADLPPELHCPMCKEVMKDAVLASKCCLNSFCDKCIRDYIISNSKCVCGETNVLADDLLPNKTLRDTINRILESGNCSTENAGSTFQVQDMESILPIPKIPSPALSAASKEEQKLALGTEETLNPSMNEAVDEAKPVISQPQVSERPKISKAVDASEATLGSMSLKEPASQGSAPLVEEEVQQKLASGEAVKKKKKKKVRMPLNDMWRASQDFTAESYIMPPGPTGYNPYWTGMQPGMEGYMAPYGGPMPFMAYGLGPMDVPFGGAMPPDPFVAQGYMMPVMPPQRGVADFGMGMKTGPPPVMSREEFEARKADLTRRRENQRLSERELSREREYGREVSSGGDASSMKSKPHSLSDDAHHRHRPKRSSPGSSSHNLEAPLPRPPKRKSEQHHDHHHDHDRDSHEQDRHHRHHHHDHDRDSHEQDRHRRSDSSTKPLSDTKSKAISTTTANSDSKYKPSVFSRIRLPEGEATSKKRKISSSSGSVGLAAAAPAGGPCATSSRNKSWSSAANGFYNDHKSSSAKVSSLAYGRKSASASAMDYESSDDDRHFKRKPSRYERSPPLPADWEEDAKQHSRGSREKSRKQR